MVDELSAYGTMHELQYNCRSKPLHSAEHISVPIFFAQNRTWIFMDSDPGLYGKWPATDRPSHSMVNRFEKDYG
jgi:hypothetical protein